MRIVIEADPEAAARRVAALIAAQLRRVPDRVLGTAAGRSLEAVYRILADLHREAGLSLRRARAFNLDEYVGVDSAHERSFYVFTRDRLVEPTDLPLASLFAPDGMASDLVKEAGRYEGAIEAAGGIDLQLLGLGRNGHLGFNEPGSSLASRTRVKALAADTLDANRSDLAGLERDRPVAAITLGLASILAARRCLLLAFGESKARAVASMVEGPVTARVPASVLQQHARVTVVLDEAAAAKLDAREYYRRAESLQRELEDGAS